MRRLVIRWLKTQWTALPLAFLIVTAIELWHFDIGEDCRQRNDPAAIVPEPPRQVSAASQPPPPSTKPPQKVVHGQKRNRTKTWRKLVNDGGMAAEIVVDMSGEVVNPHPFDYVINCPDLCRGADVFVLNYVHTAVDHFGRRARIRQTWALQSHYRNRTIKTVFFVGLTNKAAWYHEALLYESRKYGDIVQKDFVDTYRNLSYKGVAALKWITDHCSHAKYIMKTDDDVFVNMFALLKHLGDLYDHGYRLRIFTCLVWWRMHVMREGQWGIPVEVLPDDLYPPYCSGMGYVFSTDVAVAMYRVSFYVEFFWVDDAYISGFLPRALGPAVNHSDMGRAYCGAHEMGLYYHETEWYKYIFTHVHDEDLYRRTWNKLVDMAGRRTIPTPRVVRPGNLAEEYIPKLVLFPLKKPPPPPDKPKETKEKGMKRIERKPKKTDQVAKKPVLKKSSSVV